ncbi:MAG TPA: hypothetical protein PLH94_06720 [Fimbriimonadaceae bacterium]|nr:hypothetical protein [Fimbriimonadaceae bacterium]
MIQPTPEAIERRDAVINAVLGSIRAGTPIRLTRPLLDASPSQPRFALLDVAREPGPYAGAVGEFLYQFEGEEDLLHLFIVREDGAELSVDEARQVVSFLLPTVSPGLVWLKPGSVSQHFFLGHDVLVGGF